MPRESEFAFDCTLKSTIRVFAKSEEDARERLNSILECATCILGGDEEVTFEVSLAADPMLARDLTPG